MLEIICVNIRIDVYFGTWVIHTSLETHINAQQKTVLKYMTVPDKVLRPLQERSHENASWIDSSQSQHSESLTKWNQNINMRKTDQNPNQPYGFFVLRNVVKWGHRTYLLKTLGSILSLNTTRLKHTWNDFVPYITTVLVFKTDMSEKFSVWHSLHQPLRCSYWTLLMQLIFHDN